MLKAVKPAEIDLVKAERAKQFHGGLVDLRRLDLRNAKVQLLKVAEDVHHEEFGKPLPAHVVADLKRKDARGRGATAPAEALHFPDLRAGHHAAAAGFFQAKVERLQRAENALL